MSCEVYERLFERSLKVYSLMSSTTLFAAQSFIHQGKVFAGHMIN